MTKRRVGGYAWRQELRRAVNANAAARKCLRRIVDEEPGLQTLMLLAARAANALGENLEALRELERIGEEEPQEDPACEEPTHGSSLEGCLCGRKGRGKTRD